MKKSIALGIILATMATISVMTIRQGIQKTETEISQYTADVRNAANMAHIHRPNSNSLSNLPSPVQRYFQFAFPQDIPSYRTAQIQMSGQFRRPQTTVFNPTTAKQTAAIHVPGLVFSAKTPIIPLIWATAYDAYVNGNMQMKAKILSTFSVVDEKSNADLDRISLRRWLLESSLYPMALLPSEQIQWEAIDEHHARVTVHWQDISVSMIASFASSGELTQMIATEDGDLSTPYHGSGELVERSDYQSVQGIMIPMKFSIARVHANQVFPFWVGQIDEIQFE